MQKSSVCTRSCSENEILAGFTGKGKSPLSFGWKSLAVLLLFLILACPEMGSAQDISEVEWSTEARVLGTNAILGGLGAGLAALVRGDPALPAFARGAGGGSLVYAGKRLIVDSRPGMGLLGRQLGSVGGSIIGNEVSGRGSLDRIALAAGPVRAYVGREVDGVDWRFDVLGMGAVAWGWSRGTELDLGQSLSSGTIVLRGYGGFALPGTVFYGSADTDREEYVFAHEKVHIIQYDQVYLSLGGPFEDWLGDRYPSLSGTLKHLEFSNIPLLVTVGLLRRNVWNQHHDQPWEKEAKYLGLTRWR